MSITTTATDPDTVRTRIRAQFDARLPAHFERLRWDGARLADWQREHLRVLLAHAADHSPFHAHRPAGIDPQHVELADLASLPVMTKAEMMASFDELVTDRRLARRLVEDHLATLSGEPRLLLDTYVCLASGGSSGERGVFVYALEDFVELVAAVLRAGLARMGAAGAPPPGGPVAGLVTASSPIHPTGFVAAIGGLGPARMVPVPATLPLPEIVARLNALQPHVLIGYGAKIAQLAHERRTGRLQITPQSLITTSELLTPDDRAGITAAFGVPVVDSFGSTEGLIGTSEPGESVLAFASDLCIIEPVDTDNRPVPPGTASDKVLVTNLYNRTQPLIRYELTDRFVVHPGIDAHGHFRASVEGRADELLAYGDLTVHPHVIRTAMVAVPAVSEYQVRQTPDGLDVAVVATEPLDERALAATLEANLRRVGLADPKVAIRAVAAIERHPRPAKPSASSPCAGPDRSAATTAKLTGNSTPCCVTSRRPQRASRTTQRSAS